MAAWTSAPSLVKLSSFSTPKFCALLGLATTFALFLTRTPAEVPQMRNIASSLAKRINGDSAVAPIRRNLRFRLPRNQIKSGIVLNPSVTKSWRSHRSFSTVSADNPNEQSGTPPAAAAAAGAYNVLYERGFIKENTDGVQEMLEKEAPVTYYVGFDPTADSLHVGSLVPMMAMAHLQRNGHNPLALLGGGTGMIGDPSGKEEARQMMTVDTIEKNKAGIRKQLEKFVDLGEGKGQIVDNADWLLGLKYIDFLRDYGALFSVNVMLTKASVKSRLEKGMSFLEFNYQLLQAYDFLELFRRYNCKLQIGGDDQWGNIVGGIDLVRRLEQTEVGCITFPLLTTASGAKMGKTANGAVWLDEKKYSPYDYFQFWVNADDRDVARFLKLFTFLPMSEIAELEKLQGADIRKAKQVLAFEATKILHGEEAAQEALKGAKAAFGGGASGDVDSMPKYESSFPVSIVSLLAETGACPSVRCCTVSLPSS